MRKLLFALAAGVSLIGGTPARADAPAVDFGIPAINPGASISYAGGASPLVGSNISVNSVTGIDTPLHSGVTLSVNNGVLNFTSGNFVSNTSITWSFGAGGANSITIVGSIPSIGINSTTTLLSGSLTSATVTEAGGGFKVTASEFINSINSTLAAYYGLSSSGLAGVFNIGFFATGTPPGAFSSTRVTSGDVITGTPEPSTLAIGVLGALGLGCYGLRRRLRA